MSGILDQSLAKMYPFSTRDLVKPPPLSMSIAHVETNWNQHEFHKVQFDPAHLQRFILAEDIWQGLPETLNFHLIGIQHIAAAIMTAIDRVKAVRAEAPFRGWPEHRSQSAIINASKSAAAIASEVAKSERKYSKGTDSDLTGSPWTTVSPYSPPGAWPEYTDLENLQTPVGSPISSFESDSFGSTQSPPSVRHSINSLEIGKIGAYKANHVKQVDTLTSAYNPVGPPFDEPAWEFYIGQITAEVCYLRMELIVSLKHAMQGFKKALYELGERPRRAARRWSNLGPGRRAFPGFSVLKQLLGEEKKLAFDQWWDEKLVAWFEVEKRWIGEFQVPTVDQAAKERTELAHIY
ncbi:MAG: hypothetical protein M1820_001784 [Bogoriella megaspora]|nr:MAG: hypothetical protein M1820_001784 [Bogoriella megaspora]